MNAITDTAIVASGSLRGSEASLSEPQDATTHTLRRTGRKAIRFEGWQLVEAIGADSSRTVWHDLNIFRTTKGSIVVELIVRRRIADHQDIGRVQTFEDLAAAGAWLEAYRAADDAPIPPGLGVVDGALPWMVLQSVQLRQCIERLVLDYQGLLSEVFAALDLTDAPETQTAQPPRTSGSKPAG